MERKQVTLFPSFNIRLCFCFYKYGQKYDPYLWLLPLQCHARVSKCCGEEKCSLDRWGCGPYRAILGAKEHSALHIRPFMWPSLAASCSDICMHNLQGQVSALMRCKELIILAQEKYFMKYSMQIRALDSCPRGHGFESRNFRRDKRKAYIGGWIYPEYSLARAYSVFPLDM